MDRPIDTVRARRVSVVIAQARRATRLNDQLLLRSLGSTSMRPGPVRSL
jgi:hypothetical protein